MASPLSSHAAINDIVGQSGVGTLLAAGLVVPADGTPGYATGCLFMHTDGGDGTALYINEGTVTSADFNAVDPLTGGYLPLAGGTLTGTLTTPADGVVVGSNIAVATKTITVNCLLNSACIDQCFFIADRAYQVTAIDYVHATAGSDGSAVNLQVTKDTGTDAPGAGTDLLTNNTNAGFNCKATANTVQNGTLTGTTASLQLATGNRLSLDFAGTVTALVGVQVTVTLKLI